MSVGPTGIPAARIRLTPVAPPPGVSDPAVAAPPPAGSQVTILNSEGVAEVPKVLGQDNSTTPPTVYAWEVKIIQKISVGKPGTSPYITKAFTVVRGSKEQYEKLKAQAEKGTPEAKKAFEIYKVDVQLSQIIEDWTATSKIIKKTMTLNDFNVQVLGKDKDGKVRPGKLPFLSLVKSGDSYHLLIHHDQLGNVSKESPGIKLSNGWQIVGSVKGEEVDDQTERKWGWTGFKTVQTDASDNVHQGDVLLNKRIHDSNIHYSAEYDKVFSQNLAPNETEQKITELATKHQEALLEARGNIQNDSTKKIDRVKTGRTWKNWFGNSQVTIGGQEEHGASLNAHIARITMIAHKNVQFLPKADPSAAELAQRTDTSTLSLEPTSDPTAAASTAARVEGGSTGIGVEAAEGTGVGVEEAEGTGIGVEGDTTPPPSP